MKWRTPIRDRVALSEEIASLSKASINHLRERWKILSGMAPGGSISRSFLIRAVAYRLQEQAFGGLKPRPVDSWLGSPKRPRMELT